jgi:hypothetical protein
MRTLFKLVAVLTILCGLAWGQGQAVPTGFVTPISMAAATPSGGYAYLNVDNSGNLNTTGGSGALFQIGGFVTPYAPVAQDSSGNWHFLQVDGSGNLKTSGGGSGAVISVFTRTGAVVATSGDYTCAQVTNCTALSGTGLVRQNGVAAELSSDATTSGSNAVSVVRINGVALPTLTASTGILYDTAGVLSLQATLPTAAIPAFTGDMTTAGATLTTSVVKVNGNTPGGTCTNQVVTVLNSSAVPTCTTLTSAYLPASVVYTGQTNVYTSGLQDFTSVTMEIPEAAGFTTNVNSTIGLDTTGNCAHFWTNNADSFNAATTATDTTTTHALFASATPCIYIPRAIVAGDLPNVPLNQVISPTGAIATFADGNNTLTISSAQISNNQSAVNFIEATAATGGSGNNELLVSTLANSASTVLSISQGAISTVFPTAAVSITGGVNTGATNVPGLNVTCSWNNASIAGPCVNFGITNTSSLATSILFNVAGGAGGITSELSVNNAGGVAAGNNFQASIFRQTSGASFTNFCGGVCTENNNSVGGGGLFQGSDNANVGSSTGGGYGILRGGMLTGAANAAALPGPSEVGAGFFKGTAVANVGDIVCGTTTAFTVTDCPHSTIANNIIGIATNTTAPIGVVSYGLVLVKLDGALTALGDNVCMSTTTDGLGHDNGSTTTACTLGEAIGVIVADAGTITTMSGSTTAATAMSTTLVLVQLHIAQ